LRRHWDGPVTVFQWGEEDQALRIACARCGVMLCAVGYSSLHGGGAGELFLEAIAMSPFARTLLLPAGTIVTAAIDAIFDEEAEAGGSEAAAPLLVARAKGTSRLHAVQFSTAAGSVRGDSAGGSSLLLCDGAMERWTESAWQVWCDAESALATAFAARIRVGPQTTIVTCVDEHSFADFERNWLSWNFDPAVPVCLFLNGLDEADFWLAGPRRPTAVHRISADASGQSGSLARKIANVIETEFFILLPPTAAAMPGAELFLSPAWSDYDAVMHTTSAQFEPTAVCGRVRTTVFQSLAAGGPNPASRGELAPLLQNAANEAGLRFRTVDVSRWGWKGLPALQ
jgi:hypothetical protein